jgi:hypothetical protein
MTKILQASRIAINSAKGELNFAIQLPVEERFDSMGLEP